MERRRFLQIGAAVLGTAAFGSSFWRESLAGQSPVAGLGPYGPLQPPDANGVELPTGFTSRIVAVTGDVVGATPYAWHSAPDGGATFTAPGGGWVYVSNSEVSGGLGGVSAVRFDPTGTIVDAYRILSGTSRNCAGGATPWGTWLSGEENGSLGHVWECDPQQPGQGVQRPAMGSFNHEAAAVDPVTGSVYLTEDDPVGRLYRFDPTVPGDLSAGSLFAAAWDGTTVTWVPTSASVPDRQPTTSPFNGAEGIHMGYGVVYFATKGDKRIWELVPATGALSVLHDCIATPSALDAVDNVTVHAPSGDLYVAEDGGNMELGIIGHVGGIRQVARFCRFNGHDGSEVTGPSFSPDGTRLYVSSQRGTDGVRGITFEISGPFRTGDRPPTPTTVVQYADADTFVRGGTYANATNGAATLLQVCNNTNAEYLRLAYLQVPLGQVVDGALTSAVLRLHAKMSVAGASTMEVLGVADTAWSAATVTYGTRPTPGAVVGTFTPSATDPAWFEIDVTPWVTARRAEGATRVAFQVRQTTRNGPLGYLTSAERTVGRPELVLTVTPPPAPTSTTVAPTTAPPTTLAPTTTTVEPTTTLEPTTVPPTTAAPTTTVATTAPPTTMATRTVSLAASGDTYVRGGSYAAATYGTATLLHVCNNSSAEYTRVGYLAFDVSSVGASVVASTLQLNVKTSSDSSVLEVVGVADTSWSAATLTWTGRPAEGTVLGAINVSSLTPVAAAIDVTAWAAARRAEGATAVAFAVRQQTRNGKLAYVHAAENPTGKPALVVTSAV
jgi:hypothetical protein